MFYKYRELLLCKIETLHFKYLVFSYRFLFSSPLPLKVEKHLQHLDHIFFRTLNNSENALIVWLTKKTVSSVVVHWFSFVHFCVFCKITLFCSNYMKLRLFFTMYVSVWHTTYFEISYPIYYRIMYSELSLTVHFP